MERQKNGILEEWNIGRMEEWNDPKTKGWNGKRTGGSTYNGLPISPQISF